MKKIINDNLDEADADAESEKVKLNETTLMIRYSILYIYRTITDYLTIVLIFLIKICQV